MAALDGIKVEFQADRYPWELLACGDVLPCNLQSYTGLEYNVLHGTVKGPQGVISGSNTVYSDSKRTDAGPIGECNDYLTPMSVFGTQSTSFSSSLVLSTACDSTDASDKIKRIKNEGESSPLFEKATSPERPPRKKRNKAVTTPQVPCPVCFTAKCQIRGLRNHYRESCVDLYAVRFACPLRGCEYAFRYNELVEDQIVIVEAKEHWERAHQRTAWDEYEAARLLLRSRHIPQLWGCSICGRVLYHRETFIDHLCHHSGNIQDVQLDCEDGVVGYTNMSIWLERYPEEAFSRQMNALIERQPYLRVPWTHYMDLWTRLDYSRMHWKPSEEAKECKRILQGRVKIEEAFDVLGKLLKAVDSWEIDFTLYKLAGIEAESIPDEVKQKCYRSYQAFQNRAQRESGIRDTIKAEMASEDAKYNTVDLKSSDIEVQHAPENLCTRERRPNGTIALGNSLKRLWQMPPNEPDPVTYCVKARKTDDSAFLAPTSVSGQQVLNHVMIMPSSGQVDFSKSKYRERGTTKDMMGRPQISEFWA